MKRIKSILLLAFLLLSVLPIKANGGEQKEEGLNIPEIVLEHLADAYEWHVASYEGKHLSIPLPIIVRSEQTGEWTFCTAHSLPEQYFFNADSHGKIYEKLADGTTVRPIDLSITKSVAQIWIVVIVLLTVFLNCAKWYKKRDCKSEAPRGFVGAVEMLTMTIHDDLCKSCIGEKHYKPYAPYLLTVFYFIFATNLIGLIPIFPGGANVTGNINVTMFLALCTMLVINVFANAHYWKEIFTGSAGTVEVADDSNRNVRSLYKAVRFDDSSFRKHDGGTCCDSLVHLRHIPWLVNGSGLWSWIELVQCYDASVHELPRSPCGICSGLCVHASLRSVHRACSCGAP